MIQAGLQYRLAPTPWARGMLVCLFVCLYSTSTMALDPDRTLPQIYHTAWRARDGAPSQISAMVQTKDGYLWIGTALGLFKFDGVTFESFHPPPGVTLPAYNIYALLATDDGGLWISFRPSGLGFYKDGKLTVFNRKEELPDSQVYCFAQTHDGRVWAGTHTGLAQFDGRRWISVDTDWKFPSKRIRGLFVDREGTLWVRTDDSLFLLRSGSHVFTQTDVRGGIIQALAQAKDGTLWAAETMNGAHPIQLSKPPGPETLIKVFPQQILFDRDGVLWITTQFGLCRVRFPERFVGVTLTENSQALEWFHESDGLSADPVAIILEDREGNIWVSSERGLDRFRHSQIVPVSLPDKYQRLTLLAGNDNEIWVGGALEQPLLRLEEERQIHTGRPHISASVFRAKNGDIWWGGRGKIWRQTGNRLERFLTVEGTVEDWIWEVFGANDGGLWASIGDLGLRHFKDGQWTSKRQPRGLPDRGPSASFTDPVGRVWLGYTEDRVFVVEGETVTGYSSSDGIDVGRIRVIRGRGPHYWVGGELGLALFQNGKFRRVTIAGDEQLGTVTGIIETADGTLWLNELHGIASIPAEEIRTLLAQPNHKVNVQRLNFLDGLPGAPQMNFPVSTAVQTTDGKLWFATDNGLARIDPAQFLRNEVPPPVSILAIGNDSERHPASSDVEFAAGTQHLEIDYTALSLSIPERVQFRYRLEGVDSDWQFVGTRRRAFYTNLKPGHYRFRVIASNNDGVWNEQGAMLEFSIAPAFYQTFWFALSLIVLICFLLLLAFRWRLRSMAARMDLQFRERLSERTRIAQDLHDTLLQSVASASFHLHVAAQDLPKDTRTRPLINEVQKMMTQVMEDGRKTLRELRSPLGETASLEEVISKLEQEFAIDGSSTFQVTIKGGAEPVRPMVCEQIFLITREALLNAFRHSEATHIYAEIEYSRKDLRVLIRDDGCGIDPEVLRSGREGHWGMSGMRERADAIGAKLRIASKPGVGTVVELSLPGHLAYSTRGSAWLRRFLYRFPSLRTTKDVSGR